VNLPAGRVLINGMAIGTESLGSIQYRQVRNFSHNTSYYFLFFDSYSCIIVFKISIIRRLQMCGRAGRAGHTKYGESFLLVRSSEKMKALMLSNQPIPDVSSQLSPEIDSGRGLLKAILEIFYLNLSENSDDAADYIRQTLYYSQCLDLENKEAAVRVGLESLEFLLSSQAIEQSREGRKDSTVVSSDPDKGHISRSKSELVSLLLSRYSRH